MVPKPCRVKYFQMRKPRLPFDFSRKVAHRSQRGHLSKGRLLSPSPKGGADGRSYQTGIRRNPCHHNLPDVPPVVVHLLSRDPFHPACRISLSANIRLHHSKISRVTQTLSLSVPHKKYSVPRTLRPRSRSVPYSPSIPSRASNSMS